jgi:hypothetical protein
MTRSPQWCATHWAEVRELIEAGTHSGVVATMALMQAWLDKRAADGTLPRGTEITKLNDLLERDAPLCCSLGDAARQKAIDEAAAGVRP